MLRIEIEEIFTQLFHKELVVRRDAKNRLFELEADGVITIEILIPHLHGDNMSTKIYAISAIRRIKCQNKHQILADAFLKTDDFMLISIFVDNFIKMTDFSFEKELFQKLTILEKKCTKERDVRKKQPLLIMKNNYIVEILKYLQKLGSCENHKLLFDLLEYKNKDVRFHALYTLSKINAQISKELLARIIKETSGTVKYFAEALLSKK